MKKLSELQPLIIDWAKDRDLLNWECIPKQKLKLIEELGGLSTAILNDDIDEIKYAIGDAFIELTILFNQTKSPQITKIDFKTYSNYWLDDLRVSEVDFIANIIELCTSHDTIDTDDTITELLTLCRFMDLDLIKCSVFEK